MRILHGDDVDLSSVGLVIDQETTFISELFFLQLEREWDELVDSIHNNSHHHHRHSQSLETSQQQQQNPNMIRMHEVTSEQIGFYLEGIPVSEMVGKHFAGIEISREMFSPGMFSSPSHQLFTTSPQALKNRKRGRKSNQLRSNNNTQRSGSITSSSSSSSFSSPSFAGGDLVITFHEFLYLLFPRVPKLNIDRFFMTFLPEQLLLNLKGSLSIPPYTIFAKRAKPAVLGDESLLLLLEQGKNNHHHNKNHLQKKKPNSNTSKFGRSSNYNKNNTNNSIDIDAERIKLAGPSFEEMAVGGRLDLKTLAQNNFILGDIYFPEELFDAVVTKFSSSSSSPKKTSVATSSSTTATTASTASLEWRASFFECLRVLFPRIPEVLLLMYEITTPSVPLLKGFRELFILKNPGAFKYVPPPPPPPSEEDEKNNRNNKRGAGGRNNKNEDGFGKSSSSSLLLSSSSFHSSSSTKKSVDWQKQEMERFQQQQQSNEKKKIDKNVNTASVYQTQNLPNGVVQCVNSEACQNISDVIESLKHGQISTFPAEKQTLSVNHYKTMCFETKKYSELVPGIVLTYGVFTAIEKYNSSSSSSSASLAASSRRKQQQKRGAKSSSSSSSSSSNSNSTIRISLANALRFVFPNAPLPMFLSYIDQMEHISCFTPTRQVLEERSQATVAAALATANQMILPSMNRNNNNRNKKDDESESSSVVAKLPVSPSSSPQFSPSPPKGNNHKSNNSNNTNNNNEINNSKNNSPPSFFDIQNAKLLSDPCATTTISSTHFPPILFQPVLEEEDREKKNKEDEDKNSRTENNSSRRGPRVRNINISSSSASSSSPSGSPSNSTRRFGSRSRSNNNNSRGRNRNRGATRQLFTPPSSHSALSEGKEEGQQEEEIFAAIMTKSQKARKSSPPRSSSSRSRSPRSSSSSSSPRSRQATRGGGGGGKQQPQLVLRPPSMRRKSVAKKESSFRRDEESDDGGHENEAGKLIRLGDGLYSQMNISHKLAVKEEKERLEQIELLKKQKRVEKKRAAGTKSPLKQTESKTTERNTTSPLLQSSRKARGAGGGGGRHHDKNKNKQEGDEQEEDWRTRMSILDPLEKPDVEEFDETDEEQDSASSSSSSSGDEKENLVDNSKKDAEDEFEVMTERFITFASSSNLQTAPRTNNTFNKKQNHHHHHHPEYHKLVGESVSVSRVKEYYQYQDQKKVEEELDAAAKYKLLKLRHLQDQQRIIQITNQLEERERSQRNRELGLSSSGGSLNGSLRGSGGISSSRRRGGGSRNNNNRTSSRQRKASPSSRSNSPSSPSSSSSSSSSSRRSPAGAGGGRRGSLSASFRGGGGGKGAGTQLENELVRLQGLMGPRQEVLKRCAHIYEEDGTSNGSGVAGNNNNKNASTTATSTKGKDHDDRNISPGEIERMMTYVLGEESAKQQFAALRQQVEKESKTIAENMNHHPSSPSSSSSSAARGNEDSSRKRRR